MYNSKLSKAACGEMRRLLDEGALLRECAEVFGISFSGVARHRDGKCKHVDEQHVSVSSLLALRKEQLRGRRRQTQIKRDVLYLARYEEDLVKGKQLTPARRVRATRARQSLRQAVKEGLLIP